MADEIAQLKQLQAGINAAFDSLLSSAEKEPGNASGIAAGKSQLVQLALATAGAALGGVPSVMGLSFQPLALMTVRIASDLHLFEHITKPTSLDELVEKTSADPSILGRILRTLSSIGYVKQTSATTWEPTPLSKVVTIPAVRDWLKIYFEPLLKVYGEFPQWLAKREYKTAGSPSDCVLSEVHGMTYWKFHEINPDWSVTFDSAMSIQESIPPEACAPYPIPSQLGEIRTEGDAVTMVDIGGGFGQAVERIKVDYPDVKGRFIVQDLPRTIEKIDSAAAAFEPMAYDFFTPQPIKGAKYYHFRRVLHCWDDESAKKILARVHEAMKDSSDYSRLLIHDFVLPEVGVEFREAMVDMVMMICFGGVERSESHFHTLLTSCGFKIIKIWRAEVGQSAVIEAEIA